MAWNEYYGVCWRLPTKVLSCLAYHNEPDDINDNASTTTPVVKRYYGFAPDNADTGYYDLFSIVIGDYLVDFVTELTAPTYEGTENYWQLEA